MTFTFDAAARTLRSGETTDMVCPHLAPSLAILLDHGAAIDNVYRNGWSEIDLDIHLDHGPPPDQFVQHHPLATGVATWHNDDPHYSLDEGLVCKRCRQAIAWPHTIPDHV